MRKRTLRGFVRSHRKEIDEVIDRELGKGNGRRNDEERRLWVLNNEPLYLEARRAGVVC